MIILTLCTERGLKENYKVYELISFDLLHSYIYLVVNRGEILNVIERGFIDKTSRFLFS